MTAISQIGTPFVDGTYEIEADANGHLDATK